MRPQLQRANTLVIHKNDEQLQQLSKLFIQFVQEVKQFLPISVQTTQQLQTWIQFKQLIEPPTGKIELAQVQDFVARERSKSLSNKNSAKVSLEYSQKEKTSIQENKLSTEGLQPREQSCQQLEESLAEISANLVKVFQQNDTHIEILFNMNQGVQKPQELTVINNRRFQLKRLNTVEFKI